MPGLMDLGGGAKMMDTSGMLEQAISLQSLKAQAEGNKLAEKKLEIETALKANELMNLNVANLLQKAQLHKALGDESRAQAKHTTEIMKDLYDIFMTNPQLGQTVLSQVSPNAQSTINDDGTATIEFPTFEKKVVDGQAQMVPSRDKVTITVDPKRIDPEKKANLEGQWYDRFRRNDAVANYNVVSQNFRTLKDSAKLITGQGDTAMIFAFMRILDPAGTVREGEQATARNTPGVPEQIRAMYNRALTSSGPIFGDAKSPTRANFLKAAENVYQNNRSDVIQVGRDFADMAKRERLNPQNILGPVGDIAEKEFLMTDEEQLANARRLIAPPATPAPTTKTGGQ